MITQVNTEVLIITVSYIFLSFSIDKSEDTATHYDILYRWYRICSLCRNYNPFLIHESDLPNYASYRLCNSTNNTMGATIGAGSACDILFMNHCHYNGNWCNCRPSERFSSIKPGLTHKFPHLKMPVPSQEYDSCCQFVY